MDRIDLRYVEKQTPEMCLKAVEQDGNALCYAQDQTPEICLKAVEQNGYALRYVEKQTPEMCLKAVEKNGYALQFVEKQTPETCLKAVAQNGFALQYVKNQTPEICLKAVERCGEALQYVKNQKLKALLKERVGIRGCFEKLRLALTVELFKVASAIEWCREASPSTEKPINVLSQLINQQEVAVTEFSKAYEEVPYIYGRRADSWTLEALVARVRELRDDAARLERAFVTSPKKVAQRVEEYRVDIAAIQAYLDRE